MPEPDEEEEEFAEEMKTYGTGIDMDIVKRKAFKMDPISTEEAVMCLDYIDHPFYVFRNAETGESVAYL